MTPAPRPHLIAQGPTSGPPLLVCAGGNGNVRSISGLMDWLAHRKFRVFSYQRPEPDGQEPIPMAHHVADLIAAVAMIAGSDVTARETDGQNITGRRVDVFGTSFGALLALHASVAEPRAFRRLVAHEPPAFNLLPEPARQSAYAEHRDVEEALRANPASRAALDRLAVITGTRFDDGWETSFPPRPDRQPDRPARFHPQAQVVRQSLLSPTGLRSSVRAGVSILPALGSTARGHAPYLAAEAIGRIVGVDAVRFPGSHSGATSHPLAFADTLARILGAPLTPGAGAL